MPFVATRQQRQKNPPNALGHLNHGRRNPGKPTRRKLWLEIARRVVQGGLDGAAPPGGGDAGGDAGGDEQAGRIERAMALLQEAGERGPFRAGAGFWYRLVPPP